MVLKRIKKKVPYHTEEFSQWSNYQFHDLKVKFYFPRIFLFLENILKIHMDSEK